MKTRNILITFFCLSLIFSSIFCSQIPRAKKCDNKGSPKCCTHLNAIYEDVMKKYYQQEIVDFYVLNENEWVILLRYLNGLKNTEDFTQYEGDKIVRLNRAVKEEDKTTLLIEQTRTETFLPSYEKLPTHFGTNTTIFHSFGNLVSVNFTSEIQQRFIVTAKIPDSRESEQGRLVYFPLNINKGEVKGLTTSDMATYVYPFKATPERIYNKDGTFTKHLDFSEQLNKVNTERPTYGEESEIITKTFNRLDEIELSSKTQTMSWVSLISNYGSQKLVKFTASVHKDSNNIEKKNEEGKVLVPIVEGIDLQPNYGKMFVSNNNNVFVIVHITKDQLPAIKAEHPNLCKIDTFPEGVSRLPIIFILNSDLVVKSIESIISDYKKVPISSFSVSDIDMRSGYMAIAGNSLNFGNKKNDFTQQKPWISRIKFNNEESAIVEKTSIVLNKLNVVDQKKYFNLKSVSFTADSDNINNFVVGGHRISTSNLYAEEGRAFIVGFDAQGNEVRLYNMYVGESGSNSVNHLRRMRRQKIEDWTQDSVVFMGLKMGAPTSAPPKIVTDDPRRNIHCGIWVLDCTEVNHLLEVIVTYAFFVFFAICFIGLICVALFYIGWAVIEYIIKKIKQVKNGPGYGSV